MKVWSSTDALYCGMILFGVGRQPARLNTLHIGLLFSVGRHTTRRVWSSTDVLYCGMILFSVGRQYGSTNGSPNTLHSGVIVQRM